jgi:nucleotide-binding universal stress UspA family protein
VRPAAAAYFGAEGVKESEAKAKESMLHYLSDAKEKLSLGASNVSTVVLPGEPAAEILKYVENNGVDLVVMSTHGRSGVSKWLLGNTVERVLQRSSAPVFLVPHASRGA